jgi:hypothetical protein
VQSASVCLPLIVIAAVVILAALAEGLALLYDVVAAAPYHEAVGACRGRHGVDGLVVDVGVGVRGDHGGMREVVEVGICSVIISKWVCVVYWRVGVVGACGNRDDYDGDAGEAECMVGKAYIYITHRWYQGK